MRTHQASPKKSSEKKAKSPTPNPLASRPFAVQPKLEETALQHSTKGYESAMPEFAILNPEGGRTMPVQPKLAIGAPGDKYEQEADRVATQVVKQINSPDAAKSIQGQSVQRQEEPVEELQAKPSISDLQRSPLSLKVQREAMPEEEDLQAKSTLQRREAIGGGEASPDLASAINRARGSGQPLDVGLQRSMGQAMGANFSRVKVHTDAQSDQLNQSIQAKAFTTGQDVFFRQGAYEPGSRGGQELIAHELTHVVQQNGGAVQRSPLPPQPLPQHPITETLSVWVGERVIQGKSDILQRRGENPHNTSKSHQGWQLTAHHIVSHSKLVEALRSLSEDQRKEVLIASIPTKLTKSMLDNVKVKLTSEQLENEASSLANIQKRLVDKNDHDEVNGIRIDDIRQSFFEWQGGNQYQGPNTSIRAEPSANKDDMDTDGQYFNQSMYQPLKASGDQLYGQLGQKNEKDNNLKAIKKKKLNKEADLPKLEAEEASINQAISEIQESLYQNLLSMLRITKDISPAEFDPTQWEEISSLEQVEALAQDGALNRKHITDYAYFKIPISDWESGKYDLIVATNAGKSEFNYAGTQMKKSKLQGSYIYVPINDAKKVIPLNKTAESGANLYKYLQSKNTSTSTYLPKQLPTMQKARIPLLQELSTKADIKAARAQKEVNRLNNMKSLTEKQADRLKLRSRKLDNAIQEKKSYTAEIAALQRL